MPSIFDELGASLRPGTQILVTSKNIELFKPYITCFKAIYLSFVDPLSFSRSLVTSEVDRFALEQERPKSFTQHLAIMPGFDFSNYNRNAALHSQGIPLPKATSTGTTIVGCIFDGGVVIAADTRATTGPIVADKVYTAQKITCRHNLLIMYYRIVRSSII